MTSCSQGTALLLGQRESDDERWLLIKNGGFSSVRN
uniref:Uncharacterized protein n=1 Tax=Anguilla anguilla TaxID=7936 RepID=A0A0E9PCV1_ANGAN